MASQKGISPKGLCKSEERPLSKVERGPDSLYSAFPLEEGGRDNVSGIKGLRNTQASNQDDPKERRKCASLCFPSLL